MDAKANPVTVEREGHTPLPEVPVSWNVRYVSPGGFSCQLTLRGDSGADLLPRTVAALAWLTEHGCTPNGARPLEGYQGANPQPVPHPASDKAWCDIHNCEMKRREKDGQTWYSHRLRDGTWCRGTAISADVL